MATRDFIDTLEPLDSPGFQLVHADIAHQTRPPTPTAEPLDLRARIEWAYDQSAVFDLSSTANSVLRHIAWRAVRGEVYETQDRIAAQVGADRKTVNRAIKRLVQLGLVTGKRRMGQATIWRPVWPEIAPMYQRGTTPDVPEKYIPPLYQRGTNVVPESPNVVPESPNGCTRESQEEMKPEIEIPEIEIEEIKHLAKGEIVEEREVEELASSTPVTVSRKRVQVADTLDILPQDQLATVQSFGARLLERWREFNETDAPSDWADVKLKMVNHELVKMASDWWWTGPLHPEWADRIFEIVKARRWKDDKPIGRAAGLVNQLVKDELGRQYQYKDLSRVPAPLREHKPRRTGRSS